MNKHKAYEARDARPRKAVTLRLSDTTAEQWRELRERNPDLIADDILARLLTAPELCLDLVIEADEAGYCSKHKREVEGLVALVMKP